MKSFLNQDFYFIQLRFWIICFLLWHSSVVAWSTGSLSSRRLTNQNVHMLIMPDVNKYPGNWVNNTKIYIKANLFALLMSFLKHTKLLIFWIPRLKTPQPVLPYFTSFYLVLKWGCFFFTVFIWCRFHLLLSSTVHEVKTWKVSI